MRKNPIIDESIIIRTTNKQKNDFVSRKKIVSERVRAFGPLLAQFINRKITIRQNRKKDQARTRIRE